MLTEPVLNSKATRRNIALVFALLVVMLAGIATRGDAQTAVDGAVGGTVLDKSESVVPNASVLVHSNATNAEQTTTSDSQGYFRVIHLQPGAYTVTVTLPGFQTFKSNATVQVGLLTNIDARLEIGAETTTVEVASETPAINTTSADFSNVIDTQVLRDLPVNNYRWSSYALLTPGVVVDSLGFGLLSFRGQSTLQNNVSIDGADDNQAFFGEERGRTRAGYSTAKSAIQEFQVNTSNYTVEYGRAVGGVVNSVSNSGGNTFHGDLYFYDRDAGWGAKNAFTVLNVKDPTTGAFVPTHIKPKDWRKQFGGAVGGPIFRDKLFFFLAIDKFKRNFPGTAVASNPTSFFATPDAALPAGTACNGPTTSPATVAPSAIDASACSLAVNLYGVTTATVTAAQYASAASAYVSGLNGLNTMLGTVPRSGDQTIFFPKIDWQVNGKNHVSMEVNRLNWHSPAGLQSQATNTNGKASFGNDDVKLTFGVAKLDTILTSHLTNEIRFQYGRDFEFENHQTPTPYEQANLVGPTPTGYVNSLGLPPSVSITNGFTFGTSTSLERARFPDERRFQIADTANWSRGNHSVKFGMDYLHTDDLIQNLRTQFGSYSYGSLLSYITDINQASVAPPAGPVAANYAKHYSSYNQAFGPLAFDFVTHDFGFFVQDEWKAMPRLSLTLGARYDYERMPAPYASLVNPDLPGTASLPTDKNNFAPRLGFAYDVFGTGKTSIRGGFGMFYGRTINSTIYSALTSTGNLSQVSTTDTTPVSQVTFAYTPSTSGSPTFPQIIASAGKAGTAPAAVFFDKSFQTPYVYQADLTIEQDLGWHTTFGISWLGAVGMESPQFVDVNLPPPNGTITYNITDSSGKGRLPAGSTYTTKFFPKTVVIAPATCLSLRPNCSYGALTKIISDVNSSYNAMAVQLKRQMTNNLSFQMNYTWSHGLDYGGNNSTFTDTNDTFDPTNPRGDYGNSNQNVPHRLVMFAIYQTPKAFTGIMGYLLNDYQISPSYAIQSGLPYSAGTSGTPAFFFPTKNPDDGKVLTSTGLQTAVGGGVNGSNGAFRIDVLGRNSFQQPRTQVLDLRLSKRFVFADHYELEILGESFNLANHQNATGSNAVNSLAYSIKGSQTGNSTLVFNTSSADPTLPLFGAVTNTNSNYAYTPRQIQLGAKFHF